MPRKPAPKAPRQNAIERDPRFKAFQELYVERQGNAYRAAIQAGYTAAYAKSHAHLLASRLRLQTGPVLRRFGLDEVFVARKLKRLSGARMPKWNRERGAFQLFGDGGVQLRATELVADLLEMKPAIRLKGEGPNGAIPVIIKTSIARPQHAAAGGKA